MILFQKFPWEFLKKKTLREGSRFFLRIPPKILSEALPDIAQKNEQISEAISKGIPWEFY